MQTTMSQSEELTVSDSVVVLTPAKYGTLNFAVLTIADADMRFWVSGETPTTSFGHIAYDKDQVELESAEEIASFSAIRNDAADVELSASYGVRHS